MLDVLPVVLRNVLILVVLLVVQVLKHVHESHVLVHPNWNVPRLGIDTDPVQPSYLDEHAKVRIGLTPSKALETLPLFALNGREG